MPKEVFETILRSPAEHELCLIDARDGPEMRWSRNQLILSENFPAAGPMPLENFAWIDQCIVDIPLGQRRVRADVKDFIAKSRRGNCQECRASGIQGG